MPIAIRAYVKPDNTLRQLRELRRLVPAFEQVQLIRVWSGIEGYTADWQPVMGPSATTRRGCTTPSASAAKASRSARAWAR